MVSKIFQFSYGEFEIDLVNEVGKRLGKDVKIENIPFNGLFSAVQSGQIDAAVSSITITPKRLLSVSFAQPYYDSDQSLTVTAAGGLKSRSASATSRRTAGEASVAADWQRAKTSRPAERRARKATRRRVASAEASSWRARAALVG